MHKNHFLILFILIYPGVLWLNSCQPISSGCIPVTSTSYSLTNDDKSKLPYTGTDTMVFISNSGQMVTLTGHGKVTNFDTKIIKGAAPPECPQPSQSYEYQMINLTSGNPFLNEIDFYLARVESPNYYSSTGSWVVNGGESYTNYYSTLLDDSAYTDTVFVNGKLINCIIITADTGDVSNVLYFNHNYGVLRFILPQSQVWYRQ